MFDYAILLAKHTDHFDRKFENGDIIDGSAHLPNVQIKNSVTVEIERLFYQKIDVRAFKEGDTYGQDIVIARLVAQTKDGHDIEIQREAFASSFLR